MPGARRVAPRACYGAAASRKSSSYSVPLWQIQQFVRPAMSVGSGAGSTASGPWQVTQALPVSM
jgi:hypothetical protein